MEDQFKDANSTESSDVQADETQESSPVAPAEAPAQQAEQEEEKPFHEHPRFRELNERTKKAEQEAEHFRRLAENLSQRPVIQQSQLQETNPYIGMSEDDKHKLQSIIHFEADKIANEKAGQLQKSLENLQTSLSVIAYERFQNQHPDVKSGSEEENSIAEYVKRGYFPDDAYKIVFFEKNAQTKVKQVKEQAMTKVQQKASANLETTSIPSVSGLPQKPKQTVREFAEQKAKEMGLY